MLRIYLHVDFDGLSICVRLFHELQTHHALHKLGEPSERISWDKSNEYFLDCDLRTVCAAAQPGTV